MVSSLANVNLQVNAGINLLNTVSRATGGGSGGKSGVLLGGLGGATHNIGGKHISKTIICIQKNCFHYNYFIIFSGRRHQCCRKRQYGFQFTELQSPSER